MMFTTQPRLRFSRMDFFRLARTLPAEGAHHYVHPTSNSSTQQD